MERKVVVDFEDELTYLLQKSGVSTTLFINLLA